MYPQVQQNWGGNPAGPGPGMMIPGSGAPGPPGMGMPGPMGMMAGPMMGMPPGMPPGAMGGMPPGMMGMPPGMMPPGPPQLQCLPQMQAANCFQSGSQNWGPRPSSGPQWQQPAPQASMNGGICGGPPPQMNMNYNYTGPPQPPQSNCNVYGGAGGGGGYMQQPQHMQNGGMQPAGSVPPIYLNNMGKKMSRKKM